LSKGRGQDESYGEYHLPEQSEEFELGESAGNSHQLDLRLLHVVSLVWELTERDGNEIEKVSEGFETEIELVVLALALDQENVSESERAEKIFRQEKQDEKLPEEFRLEARDPLGYWGTNQQESSLR
jgi:hypothetical protein